MIHHNLSVPESLTLKYLPPYSLFLNQIEAVFSIVKARIKQQLPKVNAGISQPQRKKELSENVWKTLSETNSLGIFHRHCSGILSQCLLKEAILGD